MPDAHIHSLVFGSSEKNGRNRLQLSSDEMERARAMPAERGARFRESRSFVRNSLANHLGCDPLELELDWPVRSKPRLVKPSLHFNLSHTNDLLVLAVVHKTDVGIDLETPGRNNRLMAIARRYFPEAEYRWIQAAPDPNQKEWRFLQLWTLKESLCKLLGRSLGPEVLREISQLENDADGLQPRPGTWVEVPVQQQFARFRCAGKDFLLSLAVKADAQDQLQLRMDRDFELLN